MNNTFAVEKEHATLNNEFFYLDLDKASNKSIEYKESSHDLSHTLSSFTA